MKPFGQLHELVQFARQLGSGGLIVVEHGDLAAVANQVAANHDAVRLRANTLSQTITSIHQATQAGAPDTSQPMWAQVQDAADALARAEIGLVVADCGHPRTAQLLFGGWRDQWLVAPAIWMLVCNPATAHIMRQPPARAFFFAGQHTITGQHT